MNRLAVTTATAAATPANAATAADAAVARQVETPAELLGALREQVRRIEQSRRPAEEGEKRCGTGCSELNSLLPGGGFGRGTLVEWLSADAGCGAGWLALGAAREAASGGGTIVVVEPRPQFYPPAAAAWGIDLDRVLVVRGTNDRDLRWAWDQALRCPGVAAVWGEVERLDDGSFRRWQLAAEAGGSVGLLLRSTRVRGRPSWADVQLVVHSLPGQGARRWRIEVTRLRGGRSGGVVEVEMDDVTGTLRKAGRRHETHPLSVAAELAAATPGRRSAGA